MPSSRTITGFICLALISAPIIIAPFQLKQSLAFVHDMENRTPNTYPEFTSPSDLADSKWWASVSNAFEDRVPFRKQMITLDKKINPGRSGDHISRKVERGIIDGDNTWLFFRKSVTTDLGTLEDSTNAISTIEHFISTQEFDADLFLVVAPNKVTIYPEMLTPESTNTFAQTKPQRDLIQQWFAEPGYPYRVDIWTPMRERKSAHPELVYEPAGSHFNSHGAMVMAEHIINAIDSSLYDPNQIIEEWTRTDIPDIAKVTGDWDIKETNTRLQIHRPGIKIVELWDNETQIQNPDFLTINTTTKYGRKRVKNQSQTGTLVPGKTLIMYDSFIEHYLFPTLAQYFEEVEFVHLGTINPQEFQESLRSYDRVIFETAERHFVPRSIDFFSIADPSSNNATQPE